jgi:hypothetical protein
MRTPDPGFFARLGVSAVHGCLAVVLGSLPAAAQQAGWKPKPCKIPEAEIDRAIENGVNWLKNAGAPAGPWRDTTSEELVLYTLYHGGCPKADPAFQRYLQIVVDRDPKRTYGAALAAMCLSQLDKAGYQWKIEQLAQFLVDNQGKNGQWGYGEPIPWEKPKITLTPSPPPAPVTVSGPGGNAPARKPAPDPNDKTPLYGTTVAKPEESKDKAGGTQVLKRKKIIQRRRAGNEGDNSNSQYAALGLRACAEAGFEIDPKCLNDALGWWQKCHESSGGWNYAADYGPQEKSPWGSMTVGGIGSVAIYHWMLGRSWKGDAKIQAGLNWLNANWDVTKNPKSESVGELARWHYYYLYGLERAGMLVGTDFVGKHDWYEEGALYLLKNQDVGGSWKSDVYDTCFAILFLRRATKALPPKVYSGPQPGAAGPK